MILHFDLFLFQYSCLQSLCNVIYILMYSLQVVGGYMLTACSDGTARCYHLPSGQVVATYTGHTDAVTCIGVLGQPDHLNTPAPNFKVVTGSADKTVYICSGQVSLILFHTLKICLALQ